MFNMAYVILPFSQVPPTDAIASSLARFERGGPGELSDDWLQFHDETESIRKAHETHYVFTRTPTGLQIEGGDTWEIDIVLVLAEMDRRAVQRWGVCFAQIEPDLTGFVDRFGKKRDCHPATRGFGRWLNPLGYWDWWDLGGRFHGRITGNQSLGVRSITTISSGPCAGRAVLGNLEGALANALDHEQAREVAVETDVDIELVSRLLIDLRAGHDHALPGVVVLPQGSFTDAERWLAAPPATIPSTVNSSLEIGDDADWRQVVEAAYGRFHDHWAANVAFHY